MKPQLSVCIYCGSRTGTDQAYARVAHHIGTLLAENGIRMVYGGGGIGLMGIAARAALDAGGTVVGVITKQLHELEVGLDTVSEQHIVENMHGRKMRMFELADSFIALPGGSGTLDEIAEILSWRQLGLHDKPCILLNHAGYWEPLAALLARMQDHGFLSESGRDYFHLEPSPEAAVAHIISALGAA